MIIYAYIIIQPGIFEKCTDGRKRALAFSNLAIYNFDSFTLSINTSGEILLTEVFFPGIFPKKGCII